VKDKYSSKIQIHDRNIYINQSKKGWSVVIMPDNILIDNFHHGYPHIHPDRDEIVYNDPQKVYDIISVHILREKGVKIKKLKEELLK
jgi:hypothetical protein